MKENILVTSEKNVQYTEGLKYMKSFNIYLQEEMNTEVEIFLIFLLL